LCAAAAASQASHEKHSQEIPHEQCVGWRLHFCFPRAQSWLAGDFLQRPETINSHDESVMFLVRTCLVLLHFRKSGSESCKVFP
jgi:hypothetical protein